MSGKARVMSGRWWRSEFASLGMPTPAPGRVLRQGDLNCGLWGRVVPAGNGRYELVVENSGMVLDNQNCGTANGTPARLWMWLNNTCRLWSIAP
ncbi:RICIN domain-containing protein [Streptosporangium amethystogenes]|uniref:RICIN domain-containing protein n=1 Tax=Streptosporangium amethystogenes TaxID=2002 RepID=UPI00379C6FBA